MLASGWRKIGVRRNDFVRKFAKSDENPNDVMVSYKVFKVVVRVRSKLISTAGQSGRGHGGALA